MFRSCLFRARLGFGARPCRFRALVLAFAVAICSPDALRIGWLLFCPSAARIVRVGLGFVGCRRCDEGKYRVDTEDQFAPIFVAKRHHIAQNAFAAVGGFAFPRTVVGEKSLIGFLEFDAVF